MYLITRLINLCNFSQFSYPAGLTSKGSPKVISTPFFVPESKSLMRILAIRKLRHQIVCQLESWEML